MSELTPDGLRERLQKAAKVLKAAQQEIAAEEAAEQLKAAHASAAARAHLQAGAVIEGKGVFLQTFAPKDDDGKSLGMVFDVYVAPQDLQDAKGERLTAKYTDTVIHVAKLQNWHGHDGAFYTSWNTLRAALVDGTYNGAWVIPPQIIQFDQTGWDAGPESMKFHAQTGALKGTFKTVADPGKGHVGYWSSTPAMAATDPANAPITTIHATDFGKHGDMIENVAVNRYHCRVIRLERIR